MNINYNYTKKNTWKILTNVTLKNKYIIKKTRKTTTNKLINMNN